MSQERMVNMAFVTAAMMMWILTAHLVAGGFDLFRPEWDIGIIGREFRLSNLVGIAVGVLGGIALWRNEQLFSLAHEVAGELRKVTWPSKTETRLLSIVVVVTTVLVSAVLWAYDAVFGAVTRTLFKI